MPINYYIFLSIALFAIGIVGVLTRRNAIIIFMCIELMLNAVNLGLNCSKLLCTAVLLGQGFGIVAVDTGNVVISTAQRVQR